MRLAVLLGLLANLFAPVGDRDRRRARPRSPSALVVVRRPRSPCSAVVLGVVEVFTAKIRLFRVPELLAGSFVLAFLAVTASFFLG